jgi:hypothetical protein
MASRTGVSQSAPEATGAIGWLAREDPTRFAAFRIALATVLLADIIHLLQHLRVFTGTQKTPLLISALLFLWSAILIFMIVGFFTRAASIANYLFCALILGICAPAQGFSQGAGDSIAISLSLLAVILPCRSTFAVDRIGAAESPHLSAVGARWLLVVYLSSVYVDSGIHKLISPMWHSGLGVATPMGLPNLVWMNVAWIVRFPATVLRFMSWGVIAFELLFPCLYAWRRSRLLAVVTGISLHIGIAVLYPIPVFSGLMIAIYLCLLPESCYGSMRHLDMRMAKQVRNSYHLFASPKLSRVILSSRLAVAAIVLWGLFIGGAYAPKYVSYAPIEVILKAVRKGIFVTTGIAGHEVFADGLFAHYGYQVRLIPADLTASAAAVPYSRNGLFAWSVRDRVWENWWKLTQAPWTPINQAESFLANWADFYWHPDSTIRIDARLQHVEMHDIDTSLFSRNNAVPWNPVGTIRLRYGSRPEVTWANPPTAKEKGLGDYLSRVLTRDSQ